MVTLWILGGALLALSLPLVGALAFGAWIESYGEPGGIE
jgi:hypothetical protein